MPETDGELLRSYLDGKDDGALAELIRRHVDLIYSAALRQVGGDTHFAEDVTQEVFADLVAKAGRLRGRADLTGWLFTSARFEAANLVRAERRRKTHNLEALKMDELRAQADPAGDWTWVRGLLDQAIHELGERDREALLLRYFRRLPLVEVGAQLGVSENAASKSVERALDRLRRCFERKGILSTGAALAAALEANAVGRAPVALAPAIAGSLPAGALAVAATAASSVLMIKNLTIGALAILLLLTGGIAVYESMRIDALKRALNVSRLDNLPVVRSTPSAPPAVASSQPASLAAAGPAATVSAPPEPTIPRTFFAPTNAGRATPDAAFETSNWALEEHQAAMMAEVYALDDDAKTFFQLLYARLPADAQAFFTSPDRMGNLLFAAVNNQRAPKHEILGATYPAPDVAVLSFIRAADGRTRTVQLVHAPDGWKIVIKGVMFADRSRIADFEALARKLASAQVKPE